jgi:hypothetical protein
MRRKIKKIGTTLISAVMCGLMVVSAVPADFAGNALKVYAAEDESVGSPELAATDDSTDCEHTTTYEKWVTESTCSLQGAMGTYCSNCGKLMYSVIMPTADHDWVQQWRTEPTYRYAGTICYTCSVCGTQNLEEIPKLECPHANIGTTVFTGSCIAEGAIRKYCEDCDEVISEESTGLGDHDESDVEEITEATYTHDGLERGVCSICGETIERTIPKLVCDHGSLSETVVATATYRKAGSGLYTCNVCGQRFIKEIPKKTCKHTSTTKVVATPATCVTKGVGKVFCRDCRQYTSTYSIATTSHTYDSGVVTKEASVTAAGELTYTCIVCGSTKTTAIPKLKLTVAQTSYEKVYGSAAFSLGAKTNAGVKLTYKSSNTSVVTVTGAGKVAIKGTGSATVTISSAATDKYKAATKKVTITVKPKATAIKSVTSTKKGTVTVNWTQDTQVSGYEITTAADSGFTKSKKTYTVASSKTVTKALTKYTSGQTCYVKITGYKTINGKKVHGSASKVLKVKVK